MTTIAIGADYGSDSVRSIAVDTSNGSILAEAVCEYPRWKKGFYCDPASHQYRQHPQDYIDSLQVVISGVLSQLPKEGVEIKGIGFDTTGSTPVAVNKQGTPLSLTEEFKENPHAMFILWKDHTGAKEADEINALCKSGKFEDYSAFSGGVYSSEWYFSKILHTLRADSNVAQAAFSWVEHCDWLPALLSGNTDPLTLKRSRCAAGHKALWHAKWGGLPPEDFFTSLDPLLAGLRANLFTDTYTADNAAGTLCQEWAHKLGLPQGIGIATGAFDAHMGAVGAGAQPFSLCKVIGTSTCDMITAPLQDVGDKLIPGICGQVDGSILPGFMGLEAGQSAFGDIYAWYKRLLEWPIKNISAGLSEEAQNKLSDQLLNALTAQAEKLKPGQSGIMAMDWHNGRRTPFANANVAGAITGLTLGSEAPAVFRALIEATAFGSRAIMDTFINEGINIKDIVAIGGIAQKSPLVMQILADVLNKPIKVSGCSQACALGAAMFGAVAGGAHADIFTAQETMGGGIEKTYTPQAGSAAAYGEVYKEYQKLGGFIDPQL